jgi:hypothetical protein
MWLVQGFRKGGREREPERDEPSKPVCEPRRRGLQNRASQDQADLYVREPQGRGALLAGQRVVRLNSSGALGAMMVDCTFCAGTTVRGKGSPSGELAAGSLVGDFARSWR